MRQTTFIPNEKIEKQWFVVDATDLVFGRLISRVAHIIKGKHKITYTPNQDCGDNIIIVNIDKVNWTGNKMLDKKYYNYSGYAGGIRERNLKTMTEKYPEELFLRGIKGMIPKTKLGRKQLKNVRVFVGPDHNLEAQKPKKIDIMEFIK